MTLDKIINATKNYFVDTTGSVLASIPIYATIETFVAGMNVEVSLESRIKIVTIRYCGLGMVYAKGRDLSRKIFKIEKESSETKKIIHDSVFTSAFNFPIATLFYLSSGASTGQALIASACNGLFGMISGPIMGYNIDVFRDLMGTRNSERTPSFIKNIGKSKKKLIAAGLILTSLLATAGVYTLKNYVSRTSIQESTYART